MLVALLGFCGALVGDNLGFAIGHFGGRRVAERYGRYVFLAPQRLDEATHFSHHHGGKIIIVAHSIEGLRQANDIIAGPAACAGRGFSPSTRSARRALGPRLDEHRLSHIDTIYHDASRCSTYLAIAVDALLVAYITRRIVRALRTRAHPAA